MAVGNHKKHRLVVTYRDTGHFELITDDLEMLLKALPLILRAVNSGIKAIKVGDTVISLESFHSAEIDINPRWQAEQQD